MPNPNSNFSVSWRNDGHWDIIENRGRIRIRGEPGNVLVIDERDHKRSVPDPGPFRTVQAAMTWITDDLMYEGT